MARQALQTLVLVGLVCAAAGLAQAQNKGEPSLSIAVVDMQRVLREVKAAKDVRSALDEQRKKFEASLGQTREELHAAQEQLRSQQTILTPEAMAVRRRELEQQFSEARRQTEEKRAQLTQVFNKAMLRVRQEINRSVADLMKDKKVTIAMPRSSVLIFDDKLEITEEVIASVNKTLPKFDIRFKAKPAGGAGAGPKTQGGAKQ